MIVPGSRFVRRFAILAVAVPAALAADGARAADEPVSLARPVSFERDVLPTLKVSCFKCHSDARARPKAGLRLDSREGLAQAAEDYWLIPGDPDDSRLLTVAGLPKGHDEAMPPAGQAPAVNPEQLALLRRWIEQGADPGDFERYDHPVAPRGVSGLAERAAGVNVDPAAAAARIDALIAADLRGRGLVPTATIDDAAFLRRAYLTVIGRPPTVAEAEGFLADARPDRRVRLTSSLLNSPGRVSRQFNEWADVLRVQSKQNGNLAGAWVAYLKRSLAENTSYDEWAAEVVGARGFVYDDPAVGFHLRDDKNRLAGFEATCAVFLGVQVGCAQCHDHPFEPITRRDYFEMYGYFAGVVGGVGPAKNSFFKNFAFEEGEAVSKELHEAAKQNGIFSQEMDRFVAAHQIFGHKEGLGSYAASLDSVLFSRFPHDYQYEDGAPGKRVMPQTLFGPETPVPPKGVRPQQAVVDWMATPDNLRFTHVIANRMFHQTFGRAPMGPLLEILPEERTPNPALSAYLAELMVALDYDLRAYQDVLLRTDLFARAAVPADEMGEGLRGPALRRVSAEQAWDALVTLAREDVDAGVDDPGAPDFSYQLAARDAADTEELLSLIETRAAGLGDRAAEMRRTRLREREVERRGFLADDLRRASELPQPAPPGHFLKIFGQADRETIDDSWDNPTVPQCLTLLNSPLLDLLTAPGTPLHAAWAGAETDARKVDRVFLAVLSRWPTDAERREILDALDVSAPAGLADLTWCLVNHREFLFVP